MSKQEAQSEAIRRAKEHISGIDLDSRAGLLGLPEPSDGRMNFRMLGTDIELKLPDLDLTDCKTDKPVKPGDQILILHYLLCDVPVEETNELITFRDLPGGQFYWQPFLSRSVNPLIARIQNNLDLLRKQLDRFDWQPIAGGDLSARIHCIGKLYLTLVYHKGDDEFGPAADILLDSCIKRVYNTEDAAVLASRICIGLL